MLRLKPIRRARRRGPSRDALRVADAAFWLAFAFALLLGAERVARGMPLLVALFVPPQSAEAGVGDVVRVSLAPRLGPPPALRMSDDGAPPMIAIVIDDLGGDVAHARRAIALPREVALAFLPYPRGTPALAEAARHAGHEVLVHVPMQAMGEADPGPMALSVSLPAEENVRRLDWALARVPGFEGINNHEGSRFTADAAALAPVMEDLKRRGVFFFDSRTTAQSRVLQAAHAAGVESAARDVFLDDVATIDGVDAQLRALEAKARAQGAAIAIGHPHDITLAAVAYWTAHQRSFRLVTLTEAMRRKSSLPLAGG
jgi:polysaccharide deacetylase 2 family uncharacterized protein YibQ